MWYTIVLSRSSVIMTEKTQHRIYLFYTITRQKKLPMMTSSMRLSSNKSYVRTNQNACTSICIYRVFQKFVDILKSLYFIQILYISLHFLKDINKSYCLSIFRTVL